MARTVHAGEGYQVQHQMRQEALNQAYKDVPKTNRPIKHAQTVQTTEVPKPDIFDQAYVGLRAYIPGWVMGSFIIVGALTIGLVMFKKQIRGLIVMWGKILESDKKGSE